MVSLGSKPRSAVSKHEQVTLGSAAPNSRQLPPLHLSIPFPGQLQPSFTSSDFANILFSCSMADSRCQYLIWVVKKRVHVTSGIQEWQVGNVSAWLDFFFFIISCMLTPIWGKLKEDVFSFKHLKKLFSAVFRKGGTREFLSETTRNLHEYGQKLKVNLLLCRLRDSGLFRVT